MLKRLCCGWILPALVAFVAIIVGYIASSEVPLGTFFWLVHQPLWLKSRATPPVPRDMQPAPRPEGEMFLTLPDGAQMPASGIGTCCRATAYHDESVRRTVLWYLLQGGRLIDTAELYLNHRAIGEGIRMAMRRGVPRSEIFVTTKIPGDFLGTNRTELWVERALDELGLDYIDLVLIHFPRRWLGVVGGVHEFESCCGCASPDECRRQTWAVLSAARTRGQIRNLGVSNFAIHQIESLRSLELAPVVVNQLQYHPWVPAWQEEIADYCRKHHIHLTAYFSLGGIANKGRVDLVAALQDIGKAHNATAGQVLLRWGLQSGLSVIPGTGNPAHMRENLAVYGFTLSEDEMKTVKALGNNTDMASKFMCARSRSALPSFPHPWSPPYSPTTASSTPSLAAIACSFACKMHMARLRHVVVRPRPPPPPPFLFLPRPPGPACLDTPLPRS
jgi:diketogulonate reductase-like aldo/keto reductase